MYNVVFNPKEKEKPFLLFAQFCECPIHSDKNDLEKVSYFLKPHEYGCPPIRCLLCHNSDPEITKDAKYYDTTCFFCSKNINLTGFYPHQAKCSETNKLFLNTNPTKIIAFVDLDAEQNNSTVSLFMNFIHQEYDDSLVTRVSCNSIDDLKSKVKRAAWLPPYARSDKRPNTLFHNATNVQSVFVIFVTQNEKFDFNTLIPIDFQSRTLPSIPSSDDYSMRSLKVNKLAIINNTENNLPTLINSIAFPILSFACQKTPYSILFVNSILKNFINNPKNTFDLSFNPKAYLAQEDFFSVFQDILTNKSFVPTKVKDSSCSNSGTVVLPCFDPDIVQNELFTSKRQLDVVESCKTKRQRNQLELVNLENHSTSTLPSLYDQSSHNRTPSRQPREQKPPKKNETVFLTNFKHNWKWLCYTVFPETPIFMNEDDDSSDGSTDEDMSHIPTDNPDFIKIDKNDYNPFAFYDARLLVDFTKTSQFSSDPRIKFAIQQYIASWNTINEQLANHEGLAPFTEKTCATLRLFISYMFWRDLAPSDNKEIHYFDCIYSCDHFHQTYVNLFHSKASKFHTHFSFLDEPVNIFAFESYLIRFLKVYSFTIPKKHLNDIITFIGSKQSKFPVSDAEYKRVQNKKIQEMKFILLPPANDFKEYLKKFSVWKSKK